MEGKSMSTKDKNNNERNYPLKIPSGYLLVKDNLGNDAFICDEGSRHLWSADKKTPSPAFSSSPHHTAPVCIRIQAQPDESIFSGLATVDDVYRRIREVFELQSKYRLSSLYERRWRRRTKNDNDINKEDLEDETKGNDRNGDGGDKTRLSPWSFSVAQFNALAEGLSSSSTASSMPFPHTSKAGGENNKFFPGGEYGGFTSVPNPEICLDFNLRKWRVLEVLLGGGVVADDDENTHNVPTVEPTTSRPPFDIIAMEEIDHYHNFFQPILSKFFGYDSFFIPKPSSPSTRLGWYSDGCAPFYKKDVFDLVAKKEGVYDVGTQVYLIVTLRHRKSGQVLVVATTHLKAKESEVNERIRTAQATQLCKMVCDIASEVGGKGEAVKRGRNAGYDSESSGKDYELLDRQNDIPIIIMGDFNAEPVGEGRTCVQRVVTKTPAMHSAYQIDLPPDALFTTWKTRGAKTVRRIIDYIFYNGDHNFYQARCCNGDNTKEDNGVKEFDKDKIQGLSNNTERSVGMKCTHILDVPKDHEIDAECLPGFRYPSDHMLIAARFKLDHVRSW